MRGKKRAGGREGERGGGLRGKEREERESRWGRGRERANAAVSSKQ